MPLAWACRDENHGAFLQAGLDTLSALHGALQPRDRYGCPVCLARGLPGWVRPATHEEASTLTQGAA